MLQAKKPVEERSYFVPELLYLIACAAMLFVQYIGKQEHEKLYMQGQPYQTFSILLTLCVAYYRKYIILHWIRWINW